MSASEQWFSDEALRKQHALAEMPEGALPPLELICGVYEPRVPPTMHERCANCSSDARDQAGGEERNGKRWCALCLMRGRDEEEDR